MSKQDTRVRNLEALIRTLGQHHPLAKELRLILESKKRDEALPADYSRGRKKLFKTEGGTR